MDFPLKDLFGVTGFMLFCPENGSHKRVLLSEPFRFLTGYLNGVMPLIAYTSAGNGMVKVSGRVPNGFEQGMFNLGTIFQKASARFNGQGGGHDVAAGAYVPQASINEFIQFVDTLVGSSLKVNVNN